MAILSTSPLQAEGRPGACTDPAATADDLVRLDTHLLVDVLYGLRRAAPRADPAAAARPAARGNDDAPCGGGSARAADVLADSVHLPALAFEPAAQRRRLEVVEGTAVTDALVGTLAEVLTSFCARLYGRRSAKRRAGPVVAAARRAAA